jgi:hypothetical protein
MPPFPSQCVRGDPRKKKRPQFRGSAKVYQEGAHRISACRDQGAGFSIGSLGRDESDLFNGEGPINSLFSRDHSRLFAMRLTRHDCAADESGPFPHMPPDAFDDRVFDSSMFPIDRTGESGISFQVLNLGGIRTMSGEPTPFGRFSRPGTLSLGKSETPCSNGVEGQSLIPCS